jgi:hypothetical protein
MERHKKQAGIPAGLPDKKTRANASSAKTGVLIDWAKRLDREIADLGARGRRHPH